MKTSHHFDNRDTIKSYMGRCMPTKMSNGYSRSQAFTICHTEFKHKKQNKQLQ